MQPVSEAGLKFSDSKSQGITCLLVAQSLQTIILEELYLLLRLMQILR